ncbi:MAG: hypothetical protein NUV59_01805 [Patescibacteria group bacterium]|nr:hypothetical protein [Patescibacteria group bacterium]
MLEKGIEKRQDWFTRQFAERENVDVGGGGVAEVVDVSPKTPPEKPPIMLDPSTLVPIDTYEYVIREFVKADRRTLGINHPREGGSTEVPAEDREFAKQFPTEQLRQALTLIKVLDDKNIEGLEVLGHSQRGVSDVIAARLMQRRAERGEGPQRIRNLVLFESAGLVGKDNIARLGVGFLRDPSTRGKWANSFDAMPWSPEERDRVEEENAERATRGEKPIILPDYGEIAETQEDKEKGKAVKGEQFSEYKASPSRAFREIIDLPKIDLQPHLSELRKSGVGVIVISGADDTVFPMEKLAGTMNKKTGEIAPGALRSEHVDMFLPVRGDHALRLPQVPYIEGWITVLENKQDRDALKSGGAK